MSFPDSYPDFKSKGPTPCSQVDPEIFFPDPEILGNAEEARRVSREAKKVCAGCPYLAECFQWALDENEPGVWGGTTERERNTFKRRSILGKKVTYPYTMG